MLFTNYFLFIFISLKISFRYVFSREEEKWLINAESGVAFSFGKIKLISFDNPSKTEQESVLSAMHRETIRIFPFLLIREYR